MTRKITVLISSYNDIRIKSALESLTKQTRQPDEIFVADAGSSPNIREICEKFNVKFVTLTGKAPETRSKAVKLINNDIIAILDTDEIALDDWLEKLTSPILEGEADFTGGPTKHFPPKSGPERYINELEDNIYQFQVPEDISYLPLGNSAWSRNLITKLGGFDPNIAGSEDYDINIRAINAGFKGIFVSDAFVYHDHSDTDSYWELAKERYRYLFNAAFVFIKNKGLVNRLKSTKRIKVHHPFSVIEFLLKPIALMDAFIRSKI